MKSDCMADAAAAMFSVSVYEISRKMWRRLSLIAYSFLRIRSDSTGISSIKWAFLKVVPLAIEPWEALLLLLRLDCLCWLVVVVDVVPAVPVCAYG